MTQNLGAGGGNISGLIPTRPARPLKICEIRATIWEMNFCRLSSAAVATASFALRFFSPPKDVDLCAEKACPQEEAKAQSSA